MNSVYADLLCCLTYPKIRPSSARWKKSSTHSVNEIQLVKKRYVGKSLTNPGLGEFTPAEMLKPSVVYESPKVNKNLVVPQVSFPETKVAASKSPSKAVFIVSIT